MENDTKPTKWLEDQRVQSSNVLCAKYTKCLSNLIQQFDCKSQNIKYKLDPQIKLVKTRCTGGGIKFKIHTMLL